MCSHVDPKVHTSLFRKSLYKNHVMSAETGLLDGSVRKYNESLFDKSAAGV